MREVDQELNRAIFKDIDKNKMSMIASFMQTARDDVGLKTYLDYDNDNANLIAQYLASKRLFDFFFKKIVLVVCESFVAIRTRAMKCLENIVKVDQSILAR